MHGSCFFFIGRAKKQRNRSFFRASRQKSHLMAHCVLSSLFLGILLGPPLELAFFWILKVFLLKNRFRDACCWRIGDFTVSFFLTYFTERNSPKFYFIEIISIKQRISPKTKLDFHLFKCIPCQHKLNPHKRLRLYIHRIGRSGRFGRKGVAINFAFWTAD